MRLVSGKGVFRVSFILAMLASGAAPGNGVSAEACRATADYLPARAEGLLDRKTLIVDGSDYFGGIIEIELGARFSSFNPFQGYGGAGSVPGFIRRDFEVRYCPRENVMELSADFRGEAGAVRFYVPLAPDLFAGNTVYVRYVAGGRYGEPGPAFFPAYLR